ncbi:MAG: glutaredoxin [Myxococcales bacterium]|nr:glutaredoxin [Myxococcales bacterium]
MQRHILPEDRVHPAVRHKIGSRHSDIVDEVRSAVAANQVVVVGMKQNPNPIKARLLLNKAGVDHVYLEYGSYLNQWRRRNALKMWTGWPTFPMVFVGGVLVGGASDLRALIEADELQPLLKEPEN